VIPPLMMLAESCAGVARHVAQIHMALVAKTGAGFAGCRVQRDQPRIERGLKDPPPARLAALARGIEPCGYAAIDQAIAVVEAAVDLRIVGPALRTCLRVKRDHAIEGRG
jgi:hypothetical protein